MVKILLILLLIFIILFVAFMTLQSVWKEDNTFIISNRSEGKQLRQLQKVSVKIDETIRRSMLHTADKSKMQGQMSTLLHQADSLILRRVRIREAQKLVGDTASPKLDTILTQIDDALTRTQLEADELLVGLIQIENQGEQQAVERLLHTLRDHNLYLEDINQSFEELRDL